jgi:hypothetical protein
VNRRYHNQIHQHFQGALSPLVADGCQNKIWPT